MSKNNKEQDNKEEKKYKELTYGVTINPETKKWTLVEVGYNLDTDEVEIIRTEKDLDRNVAMVKHYQEMQKNVITKFLNNRD